ncbi:MAG: TonB-dependent receptor [Steroidobacterales bacterium]
MTDLCMPPAATRFSLRGLAVATIGLFAVYGLSGGLARAADPGPTPASDGSKSKHADALKEITIQAQRTTDALARLAQKQAMNVTNIETYNTIKQMPDVTVAEAVQRIPGISRETDEGEARYINIRGLDADLNSTTFDGVQLMPTNNASAFGGYRGVALDIIPIGLAGAITVTDTNLPSQNAEALGGTIEITPKTAPPGGKPFLEGRIGGGYEPLRGTPIIDLQVSGGTRFGGTGTPAGGVSAYSDNPFSMVATAAYYEDKRGIDDVEPAYIGGVGPSDPLYFAINNLQQRDYELHRKRYGGGLDLGYQPDAGDQYYIRAFQSGYGENYRRQFFNLLPDCAAAANGSGHIVDTLTGVTNQCSSTPGPNSDMQMGFRDERELDKESLYMAGGRKLFSGGQELDYRAAFVKGTWHKPYDYDSYFNYTNPLGPTSPISMTYAPTGEGHTPLYTISGAPGYLAAANYKLGSFGNSSAYNYDQEWSFASNLDLPVSWVGGSSEDLKAGVSARLRKKLESYFQTSYPTLPATSLAQASGGRPAESYYDDQYMNPPDILPGYLQSQLGPGTAQPSDILFDDSQYLLGQEKVYAAYAQYNVQWDRFAVVGGVRVENTHDDLGSYALVTDTSGNQTAVPADASHSYTNVFPGIQARYTISHDLQARASWSSTLARPGFNQITPNALVDLGSGQINVGNPKLKPAFADSFDVGLEDYLPHAGILSLDGFDKQIKDYIVPDQTGASISFFGGFADALRTYTFNNASHSYARGIMLDYQQELSFLPGLLSGFGLGGNYTYVDSRLQIRPGEYAQLPSSSKDTWNATVYYKHDGLLVRVAAYGVSADLFTIGGDPSSDVYNAKRTFLDFGGSYDLDEERQIYFNAQNLLNTPHAFWQGSSDRPIQREFYGQTYQAGFRFDY